MLICLNCVYISFPLEPSFPHTILTLEVVSERRAGLPVLWSSFLLVIYFTHGSVYIPSVRWRDWCWSWNSKSLATWCEELTHLKRPWCWERLKAGGEGDDRGWDGSVASLTQWSWVWVNSGSWWWTGRPGVLCSMGSRRVGHDRATELNWSVYMAVLHSHFHLASPFPSCVHKFFLYICVSISSM